MKNTKKDSEKAIKNKTINPEPSAKKQTVGKEEDVNRLVHLLQVHQIELEHQNEELRIAQEELEVSRNKYVNLFDFSPIPYFSLDSNSIIKEVNLSAGRLFEKDRKYLIGKSFLTLVRLEDRNIFDSFSKSVFNSTSKQSCELKVIGKDKRLFHVLLEGLKLDDTLEPDPTCQVALIDLTDYKRVEESLNKSNQELKLISETKEKIFSVIAHDLRSPFQSLLSSSKMLVTEIQNLSREEIVSFSKGINENLNYLFSFLKNLLEWSMLQRDMIEFNPIKLKLHDLIDNVIKALEQNALMKKISIVNSVKREVVVYADINLLQSVVQNLLFNAIKFTPTEGRIIVSSLSKDGCIEVSVQDNGIGIEPEKCLGLFKINELYSTNGTDGEKGTGLGLPLCKEFAERNGGKIWVESEIGKGSKFTFTLRKINS